MKKLKLIIIAGLLSVAPLNAFAGIKIFACEPEWESLAKEIGGDKVNIDTATSAFTDPHYIRARPSLIAAIRQSDMVFCTGGQLEIGWLPILLEKSKSSVQPGQVGHLMASDYVTKLEIPQELDRSHGDVHPGGNPHIHLNPHNLLKIADELTIRLKKIDKQNAKSYQDNFDDFKVKWLSAINKWEQKAKPLKGFPIVVHHKNWTYLIDWLGLNMVGTLEPKPGIPPSASYLNELLGKLKNKPVRAVVHAPYEDKKPARWLAEKIGVDALELPYTVGGNKNANDLYGMFDDTINKLLEAK
jgi:zinc/manganese transport system substrate-binding protein